MHRLTKPLLLFALLCLLPSCSLAQQHKKDKAAPPSASGSSSQAGDDAIARAFENQTSDIQVQGAGKVIRNLPDDVNGPRHQRFIVELSSGQTLLISHNIDLAPRINGLQVGDRVKFNGEYVWNAKGGVVHWTHKDPRGNHVAGWVIHKGKTYQ